MRKSLTMLAAAMLGAGSAASAATLENGTYNLTDYDGDRGVWSFDIVGRHANKLWSLSESFFTVDGDTATATGTATNLGDSHLSFDFDLSFVRTHDPNPGYCQFDGTPDADCDSAFSKSLIENGIVDPSSWDYFDLVAGQFEGRDTMEGLTYNIVDKSGHDPQAGIGANALETDDLGFSMWFTFMRTDHLGNHIGGYDFARHGKGDINADLHPAPVPLPAGAALLLGALGAMGLARRKAV